MRHSFDPFVPFDGVVIYTTAWARPALGSPQPGCGLVHLHLYDTLSSKTHKRFKERFLIRRNRTKRANFRCNHLFPAAYNTIENSYTNLSLSVRCQEAGGSKRARDCLDEKRTLAERWQSTLFQVVVVFFYSLVLQIIS